MGKSCAGCPARRNAVNGRKYLWIFSDGCKTADGSGSGLSVIGQSGFYSFDRGTAANAACTGSQKSDNRSIVRAWWAVYRSSSIQYRGTNGCHAWSDCGWQFCYSGGSWYADSFRGRLACGDGTKSRGRRRKNHCTGDDSWDWSKSGFPNWNISERNASHLSEESIWTGNVFFGNHPPFDRCYSYGKAAGSRYSKRETYSGDRCLRFRENDIDTGKSDSGIRVDDKWNKTSLSCEKYYCGRYWTGKTDWCGTDWNQCAFYGGNLCKCAWWAAKGICKTSGCKGSRI